MVESYEEARAQHEWDVPERYNIAADVCDKHPPDKLAMIHEHFDGDGARGALGRAAGARRTGSRASLREHGVEKGDRVAMLLPPTPETAAAFFGTYKCGAILLSMSVLYGDDGIRHRVSDSGAKVLLTDAANAGRIDPSLVEHVLLIEDLPAGGDARSSPRTRSPTTRRSSTTRPARPGWRRASCTRTATCSRTRSSSTATTCRTASCSTAWASGRGRRASRRCSGRGGSARSSSSTSARAASTRTSSSTCSRATARRTSSRRRPRCAR